MRLIVYSVFASLLIFLVGLNIPLTAHAQEIKAGKAARLEQRFQYVPISLAVNVRSGPSIFSEKVAVIELCTDAVRLSFSSMCDDNVMYAGNSENGWIQIEFYSRIFLKSTTKTTGWVLGDFFQIDRTRTTDYFLQEVYEPLPRKKYIITRNGVLGRIGPHISASEFGSAHYENPEQAWHRWDIYGKEDRVTVSGRQGNYLEVVEINGRSHTPVWIYHEYAKPVQ